MKERMGWGWDGRMLGKYHFYVNICVLKIISRKPIIYNKKYRKKIAEITLKVGKI